MPREWPFVFDGADEVLTGETEWMTPWTISVAG